MTVLDLPAYLARTGATVDPPSLEALGRLQRAHVLTFPFDNIDVLLGEHPGVELEAVQEKFVGRGRGGYCFEHATLFHAVVQDLGYDAVLRLARVGDPQAVARTHLVVVVTLDGTRWLCDPGIGIPPTAPVELRDGARVGGGVWQHEVRRVADGSVTAWQLWRERSSGWELMHTLDELPVRDVDIAMAHHWTSTAPGSGFRSSFTLARHGVATDGTPTQVTVSAETVTERRAGSESMQRDYDPAELPSLLARVGTHLGDERTDRLVAAVTRLRGA